MKVLKIVAKEVNKGIYNCVFLNTTDDCMVGEMDLSEEEFHFLTHAWKGDDVDLTCEEKPRIKAPHPSL